MHVLIVKTSSLGDIIHTLPALTDAATACPGVRFDWLIEESFSDIPRWHPAVANVIPVAWRRWRHQVWRKHTWVEGLRYWNTLREQPYDRIIDAQGLIKSALMTRMARGVRCGLAWKTAREPLASLVYQKRYRVDKKQHAIDRVRQLVAQILDYPALVTPPDYGLDRQRFLTAAQSAPYLVFLHGTTWMTKHWPDTSWVELASIASQRGYRIKLPWGNAEEQERAVRIANQVTKVDVLPRLRLQEIAGQIAGAAGVVAVDTGLGHLAAAFSVPTVSLYGPTNSVLTGTRGKNQRHLSVNFPCAPCLSRSCRYAQDSSLYPPCFGTLTAESVWNSLEALLTSSQVSPL